MMGTFTYPMEVISADGSRSETVHATVDTGSTYTCLPATLLQELGVTPIERIKSELADGSIVEDAVGEVRVRVEGVERSTIVIFADEGAPALLGAYTLEGALLVVDPVRQRLAPTHALRYGKQSAHAKERSTQNHAHTTKIAGILGRAASRIRYIAVIIAISLMLTLALGGCNLSGPENDVDVVLDLLRQSEAAYGNGEYDKAIDASTEAIGLWPDNPVPYMARGNAYRGKADYEQAIADFNIAIELAPTFGDAEMAALAIIVAYDGRAFSYMGNWGL